MANLLDERPEDFYLPSLACMREHFHRFLRDKISERSFCLFRRSDGDWRLLDRCSDIEPA